MVPKACTTTELGPNVFDRLGFCEKICAATELTYLLPTTTRVDAALEFESSTAIGVGAVFRATGVSALDALDVAVTFASPVTLQLVVENAHVAVTFAIVTFAMFVVCPTP